MLLPERLHAQSLDQLLPEKSQRSSLHSHNGSGVYESHQQVLLSRSVHRFHLLLPRSPVHALCSGKLILILPVRLRLQQVPRIRIRSVLISTSSDPEGMCFLFSLLRLPALQVHLQDVQVRSLTQLHRCWDLMSHLRLRCPYLLSSCYGHIK